MKIALAQINTTVGDLAGNADKVRAYYQQAVAQGAELVLTPELAIPGYPPRDLLVKQRFVEDNRRTLEELAATVGRVPLVVGYVDTNPARPGREHFNAAAVIRDGTIIARRQKTLLPTYDVFDEDRYFQPAAENAPLALDDHRYGLTICEDVWTEAFVPNQRYPSDPLQALAAQDGGLTAILNISASPYHLGKRAQREQMLGAVARKYRLPLVYCNLVGGNDELIFDGNSMVFDAAGRLCARAAAFAEDLLMVELADLGEPLAAEPPAGEVAALHDALVLGLRDYATKCGFRSVVLGLSGGIDSAVTACLAVEAMGAANVLGVAMPSRYSSSGSVEDARQLAENLGIGFEVVPIREIHQQYLASFAALFAGQPADTTEENIQARIRGNILMAISNKFGHLLLTTGNKSEMAVGYCTLYGDMAGGLAVIADVPKTTVYELARWVNRRQPRIPAACLTKPPSAELRPNQTDQDSLPPYEVLDEILRRYVEEHESAATIIRATGFEESTVREIVRKIDLNEYKRKQAPPCLRVTTKAFGVGRRVPIAQRYVER